VKNNSPPPDSGSPFLEFDRQKWSSLSPKVVSPLSAEEINAVRSAGDMLDESEVVEIYQPLAQLISMYAEGSRHLRTLSQKFLGESLQHTPYIIGIGGSVAVGKSTSARVLRKLLSRIPGSPKVDLVATDGFLFPLRELEARGLLERKGFPESYDTRALLGFVSRVKSGSAVAKAPKYSHLKYDRVVGSSIEIRQPDILLVEGLNVLAPPSDKSKLAISDLFDFGIYVDARTSDIALWYEDRFIHLQRSSFQDPGSYFHRYAKLSETQAKAEARQIWTQINEPNLVQNILPTRSRATLVLKKDSNHRVQKILLRKI